MVRERALEQDLDLRVECEPDLPELLGDLRRLKQVMLNLLSNAIKFTQPGGRVTLGARRGEESGLELYARDTGIGMTPDEIAIALELFGQVHSGLSRRYDGTGLGLPLARSLVELHGGSLRIDSRKGSGTTVSVLLPAKRLLACTAPATIPVEQPTPA